MQTTTTFRRFSRTIVHTAALSCLAAGSLVLQAQQTPAASASYPNTNLQEALNPPLNPSPIHSSISSSSADLRSDPDVVSDEQHFGIGGDSSQPPPRRPYSRRPSYSDRMHNSDGSNKLTVALGGGFAVPTGNSRNVFTAGYGLKAGVGYNFSKKFGVMAEVGYDHFGLQGSVITAQQNYYNSLNIIDPNTGTLADFSGLDANAHVWSITLDPIYTFYQGESLGAYVIGGGGYYHKAINFTTPQSSYYCDPYYGCYPVVQNGNFDTHSASGGGINGGAGLTFKPSRFGFVKFYTEVRYVWTNAKLTPERTNPSPISTLDNGSNSYIPVTFGIRW
jgi:Outer membrane protein beta-barrel domain